MKPTQIIFLVNDIHFNGGGERVTVNMANWFSAKGAKVKILSMSVKHSSRIFPVSQNVEIDYLNVQNSYILSKIKVLHKLNRYLNNLEKNSLVFGIGTYANVLLGTLKNTDIYAVGCEHNSFNSVSKLWVILRKLTYPKLNACTVLTTSDIEFMKRLNKNSYVIPNSTPIVEESSTVENKKFIAIGRLSKQKSFDRMIKIFKEFTKFVTDWKLDIYGEGEDKTQLESLISELNLNDYISIYPFSSEISKKYTESSCLLLTSIYEGLPMVLLEAQSYGLPIISYDCDTGPRDVILNERNGFLIKNDNSQEFVSKMAIIAKDLPLRRQMGKCAKYDSLRFSESKIFSKWDRLIQSL